MPNAPTDLIRALTDWTASAQATRPVPSWSTDPDLCRCSSPADAATRAGEDPPVFAALASRTDDRLATSAALAVVADRLGPIVWRWRRAGLSGQDLADAEADLVVEALAAMRADPTRSPAGIAQMAWHRVEARRRTARARAGRQVPLSPTHDRAQPPDQSTRRPLGMIADALASGLLSSAAAAVLWAECGLPALDVKCCSPAAWRQRRSRARRALRAALGVAGGL